MTTPDDPGQALLDAARDGDIAAIGRLLAAGVPVNVTGKEKMRPINWASMYGQTEAVRVLLDAGADIEAPSLYGHTPLCNAAGGGELAAMALLIDRGARISGNPSSLAPIHWAAMHDEADAVKLLIERGENIEASCVFEGGATPLLVAAKHNSAWCARTLIDMGANIHAVEWMGLSALHLTAKNYNNPTVADMLLRAGADPNARTRNNKTPLHFAIETEGSFSEIPARKTAFLLILAGASPDIPDADGKTCRDIWPGIARLERVAKRASERAVCKARAMQRRYGALRPQGPQL